MSFNELDRVRVYKRYYDGANYIVKKVEKRKHKEKQKTSLIVLMRERYPDINERFVQAFYECAINEYKRDERGAYILDKLVTAYGEDIDFQEYIELRIAAECKMLHKRIKTFKEKVHNNRWNNFVTLTRDDDKMCEGAFRKRIDKLFANVATREGWSISGVYEYSKTSRLHYHAIMYIPPGHMLGVIRVVKSYSARTHSMEYHHENSYFADNFGHNDFQRLYPHDIQQGSSINYIIKYIGKTGTRIHYSRNLPPYKLISIKPCSIACYFEKNWTTYGILWQSNEDSKSHERWRTYGNSIDDIMASA